MTLILYTTALIAVAAVGENSPQPNAQPVPVKDASTNVDSTRPTLNDIKAAGALRSSFRKHKPGPSTSETPQAAIAEFRKHVNPILKTTCLQCHGSDTQEGDFRIDTLDPNLLNGEDVNWWVEVLDVISNGEMPPEDDVQMTDEDRRQVVEWLTSEIQLASAVRRSEHGHTSFRRMARYEYNYALQDLLGLPLNFAKDLPPETASEDGFKNSSEVLQMTAMQFKYYRKLGYDALKKATVQGDQPAEIYWAISMADASAKRREKAETELQEKLERLKDNPEKQQRELARQAALKKSMRGVTHYKDLTTGESYRSSWRYNGARYAWPQTSIKPDTPEVSSHVAVIPARRNLNIELGNKIPDQGILRIRIRAARTNTDSQRTPALRLKFGWQASNNSSASEQVSGQDLSIEATPDDPQFYQWDIQLSEINVRNPMRLTGEMGKTPSPSEYFSLQNTALANADVQIDYVEITSPVYESWPPKSHAKIFVDSQNTSDEAAYAGEVLTNFMSRAWRRQITDSEVEQKLKLFSLIRPQTDTFQEAMLEVLATVLASPKFLYLVQGDVPTAAIQNAPTSTLSDAELATRLSMFLWCSVPDTELLELAERGQLQDKEVLAQQVQRMLSDPRSKRFSKHFVRQWLGMQLLDFLNVDRKTYPGFDSELKSAMQNEPVELFQNVLNDNQSVLDFVHTDYAMVNERLAVHYKLQDVYGGQFRKVKLTDNDIRGGVLTQAGLLAMNSDGKDSHPLKRGIWMLERLLNDPPAPPPPAVPEIDLADPEIAKLTLKERIENHRNNAACLSCHAKIDPWGIAFENFDAVGRWRTTINGKPVDASSLLFNKQPLDGMDGLKRFLLTNRQDQFVRATVYKMATFALGRPLTFGDRSDIDEITVNVRNSHDRLKDLVTLIVTSKLFQSK